MATKTNELPLAQSVSLTDNLLVDTPAGTKILPVGRLPLTLTADKLLMPGGNMSIAEYYRQYSNRNLLDNWYFAKPINQRGKTSLSDNGALRSDLFIDRWGVCGGEYALNDNGVCITRKNGFTMSQTIELALDSDTIMTFSVLTANGQLGTATTLVTKTGALDSTQTLGSDAVLCDVYRRKDASNIQFRIMNSPDGNPDDTVTVAAVKLEFGTVQTLAHKEGDTWVLNDPPPNPALELAKCQRYFARIASGTIEGTCSVPLGLANIGATEHINFLTVVPVPMRAKPFVKYHNLVLVDMTANTRTNLPDDGIVTIADCSAGNVHVNIRFEGWNLDNTHIYRIFVNAGGFLEFSSDL